MICEYDVWHKGMVIANITAGNATAALNKARKIWGPLVTVSKVVRKNG